MIIHIPMQISDPNFVESEEEPSFDEEPVEVKMPERYDTAIESQNEGDSLSHSKVCNNKNI